MENATRIKLAKEANDKDGDKQNKNSTAIHFMAAKFDPLVCFTACQPKSII